MKSIGDSAARLSAALVLLCLLWLPALLHGSAAGAAGLAVEGIDRARVLAPSGAEVVDYENAGYRLQRRDGEIVIEVEATPLGSSVPFTSAVANDSAISQLASAVTAGARSHYDATSRLLGWVARSIEYKLDRQAPQDAEAVLARRSAYCTGVARLTVALLGAAGIEAREVAGYVFSQQDTAGAQGFHRWIEVNVPDLGWVFSDPLHSHHYVPATYLRLASESLAGDGGMDGLLLERQDALATVDLYPLAAPGVRGRRNSDRQLASTLRVSTDDARAGMAVLEGNAMRRTHMLVDGETTFVGLEPGEYQLRVQVADRLIERRIDIERRQRKTLFLPVAESNVHPRTRPSHDAARGRARRSDRE